MKIIQLTQGKVALVDDEDYAFLIRWKWHARRHHRTWYAARSQKRDPTTVLMHAVIAGKMGLPNVDHRDGDGLHNLRQNLRPCTRSQNQWNRRKHAAASSQFKGVSFVVSMGRFKARIRQNGKEKHIGYFDDEASAATAYDREARLRFGEFALTNFTTEAE